MCIAYADRETKSRGTALESELHSPRRTSEAADAFGFAQHYEARAGNARPPAADMQDDRIAPITMYGGRVSEEKETANHPYLSISHNEPISPAASYGEAAISREWLTSCSNEGFAVGLPRYAVQNGFQRYGANQSEKLIRTNPLSCSPPPQKQQSVISSMIAGTTSERTAHTMEPTHRYLRRCAETIALKCGIASDEIQCYYHRNTVLVSANTKSRIDAIKRIVENKNVIEFMTSEIPDSLYSDTPIRNPESLRRTRKHPECPLSENAVFHVVGCIGSYSEGLHAERRILYHLRENYYKNSNYFLDYNMLGGRRRPCFVCGAICFRDSSKIPRGPLWSSVAAMQCGIEERQRVLRDIEDPGIVTCVTRLRNGRATFGNDSESDSEQASDDFSISDTGGSDPVQSCDYDQLSDRY